MSSISGTKGKVIITITFYYYYYYSGPCTVTLACLECTVQQSCVNLSSAAGTAGVGHCCPRATNSWVLAAVNSKGSYRLITAEQSLCWSSTVAADTVYSVLDFALVLPSPLTSSLHRLVSTVFLMHPLGTESQHFDVMLLWCECEKHSTFDQVLP